MPQTGQHTSRTHRSETKCPDNISAAGFKCVCLNARSIVSKKSDLNIIVEAVDPHKIGITELCANKDLSDADLGLR